MSIRTGLSDPYGGRSRARFPWLLILLGILAYAGVGIYSCFHG